jgi:hypothetical protein
LEPRRAAEELRKLRSQADSPEIQRSGPEHKSWKAKVVAIMQAGLGQDSETLREFQHLRYSVGAWSGAPGEAQRDAQYFAKRVRDAAGLIDAAIYQLELLEDPDAARRNTETVRACPASARLPSQGRGGPWVVGTAGYHTVPGLMWTCL